MKKSYSVRLIVALTTILNGQVVFAESHDSLSPLWKKGSQEVLSADELEMLGKDWEQYGSSFYGEPQTWAPYHRSGLAKASTPPYRLNNEVGRGVNYISGKRTRNCFVSPVDSVEVSVDGGKSINASVLSSYREVDDFFRSTSNIGAGGSYGIFSASGSSKKELVRKISDISDSTSVVFKIHEETNALQFNGWPEIHPYPKSWLLKGTQQGRINFLNFLT